MKTGVSLPLHYLAGTEKSQWTTAFGEPARCLDVLKNAGVAVIELRTVRAETDPDHAVSAVETVLKAGMKLTFHGTLPVYSRCIMPDKALQAICRLLKGPVLITVHGYRSDKLSVSVLAERTAAAIDMLLERAEADALPVRLALELNRSKNVNDPGTDWDRMLAVRALVSRSCFGFCWDMGHTLSNIRQALMSNKAPADFLKQVIHTHIHDLNSVGRTHWPLNGGRSVIKDWITALSSAGYDGVLNLELSPERFEDKKDLRTAVLEDVSWLSRFSGDRDG